MGQPDSVRASRTESTAEFKSFRAPQVTSHKALEGPAGDLIEVCDLGHCAVHTPCCPCLVLSVHHAEHAPRFMYTMVYVYCAGCTVCTCTLLYVN